MFDLFSPVKKLVKLKRNGISTGNNVFILHCKTTAAVLAALSIIVTASQFVGEPITCLAEKKMPVRVINTFCWIKTTYTIPSESESTRRDEIYPGVGTDTDENVKYHNYYQWVCFVLFFQAALFYLPRYLWKMWEGRLLEKLVGNLNSLTIDVESRKEEVKRLAQYLVSSMHQHNWYAFHFFFCEALNFCNVILQIHMMDRFLGGEFSNYGWDVVKFAIEEPDSRNDPMSKVFPKITKCGFNLYGPSGTAQHIDVLCVLPINNVNEKIYVFLWFWFVLLATLSGLNMLYRVTVIAFRKLRIHLLFSRARQIPLPAIESVVTRGCIGDWFILHQLSKNVDPLLFHYVVSDLVKHLDGKNHACKCRCSDHVV